MNLYTPWALVLSLATILSPFVTLATTMLLTKQGFSLVWKRQSRTLKWLWIIGLILLALYVIAALFNLNIVVYL